MPFSLKLRESNTIRPNSLSANCCDSRSAVLRLKNGSVLTLESNYKPYNMDPAVKRTRGRAEGRAANVEPAASAPSVSGSGSKANVIPEEGFLKKGVLQLIVVLHMASAMMAFMTIQDLLIVKACRTNLGYSDATCKSVEARSESNKEEAEEVQALVATAMMWRSVLENLFPIALVCLVGAWSDKFGRKLPIAVVLSAFVVQHVILLMCEDKKFIGVWSVSIISSLLVSMAGNNACFGMSVFSHVSDTTPKDKLSSATAITGSCFFLGVTVGIGLGGMLSAWGYTFSEVFTIAAAMESTGLILLLLFIDNNPRDRVTYDSLSPSELLMEVFRLSHIKDAVYAVVKPRRGSRRMMLWLLLLSHALVLAPMFGEGVVTYLFARMQFNWDNASFSKFMTYKTIVGFIGNFVAMAVLTEYLRLSDEAVGIVACGSQLVSSVMFAFAGAPFIMYLAPVVGIFMGAITAGPRSLIFKIIPGDETGKINAFIGSLESLTPLLITPAYSIVYGATAHVLQGGFFLLSAVLMVPPMLVYTWMLTGAKKDD